MIRRPPRSTRTEPLLPNTAPCRAGRDRLFCHGESLPVDLLLVRDDDIPGLIASGACDLGIVGRNVLLEQAAAAPGQYREWRALGFGGCRLDIAVPEDWAWEGPAQLASRSEEHTSELQSLMRTS